LQNAKREQSSGEPSDWVNEALDKKLPQWVGGFLLLFGGWVAWIGSGRVDEGRSWGLPICLCGGLLFSCGLVLIGVR